MMKEDTAAPHIRIKDHVREMASCLIRSASSLRGQPVAAVDQVPIDNRSKGTLVAPERQEQGAFC
jgi:hypothetical protein